MTLSASVTAVVFCLLFGGNAVAIKAGMSGIGPLFLAGFRFAIAAGVLAAWTLLSRQRLLVRKDQFRQALVFSSVFTVQLALFYLGINLSNASRATLIINLQPFFVLLLAHFFIPGDRIDWRKLSAILLGLAGVVFVFLEKQGAVSQVRIGDLLILGASLAWAANTVFVKRIIGGYQPVQIAMYPMVLAAPIMFMASAVSGETFVSEWSSTVVVSLAYQSLITASFGFLVWNTLLQKYGAVNLHTYLFLVPVSGVIFGGLILGEPVTYKIVVAMILVAAGLILSHLRREPPAVDASLGRSV